MAGMRPFVLCEEFASAYCDSLATDDCPSSQIAIVKPSAVPLWKVIVGPRADKLKPDPQGSGFLLHRERAGERPNPWDLVSPVGITRALRWRLRDGAGRPRFSAINKNARRHPMAWTTPTLVEICLGLEINGYLPAEF
jgi:coenzyme PQQ precursor peptide PqqA